MRSFLLLLPIALCNAASGAQEPGTSFDAASDDIQLRLEQSLSELSEMQATIAAERDPLNRRLAQLEERLAEVRAGYQVVARKRDSEILSLSRLKKDIETRKDEVLYLGNLLSEYVRNFDVSLHIAERPRYEEFLLAATLAPENANFSELQIFQAQSNLLSTSLGRLEDAFGGTRFDGTAVDAKRQVRNGSYLMVGPTALFRSADGNVTGIAVERLGSLEPTVLAYGNPADAAAASTLVSAGSGMFPFDPTLGNAHKIEATEETLMENIKKGGAVMVPIFVMAGLALLIALYKWITLSILPTPSKKELKRLYAAVDDNDRPAMKAIAKSLKGPGGLMLQAGIKHLREPRELVEEVMYEIVLTTRLKLQNLLPFIAICAASAPLLGLLGTVTGIINTFKMITVFGSGDVKSLSGGISEALITTKFGLIVAIPSLLLHAFLARKAKSISASMETSAMALVNRSSVGKEHASLGETSAAAATAVVHSEPDPNLVREQVNGILSELLGPLTASGVGDVKLQAQDE